MKRFLGLKARTFVGLLAGFVVLVGLCVGASVRAEGEDVLRATLPNGLRVVVVPNHLAPVVSTSLNYLAGSDLSPEGFPGTAHALEHMMFRGGPGLSAAQLSRLSNLIGGRFNATTRVGMTQYYYDVPASDWEIALHIEAARMAALDCSDADWAKERGAIEQEVASQMSSPNAMMYYKVNAALFAGTPYADMHVGTRESFDKTSAAMLQTFHRQWYAPNNALLVVAGDIDPRAAMPKIAAIFGGVSAKTLPARPAMVFQPVKAQTIAMETDKPYAMVYLAIRVPGLKSADMPALDLLADVMESQRFDLYGLKAQGKALGTFYSYDPMVEAGSILVGAAFPAGGNVQDAARVMEANLRAILTKVAAHGVPAELVEAAKLQERREQAHQMDSISGQASVWAEALTLYGLSSPDEDLKRIEKVSVADVNRAARTYLDLSHAVVAVLTPRVSDKPAPAAVSGPETIALAESGPVVLPAWAQTSFTTLPIPHASLQPTVSTLPNGLTLIVQPVKGGDTVTISGLVRSRTGLQESAGKEGAATMVHALMDFGTTHLDRLAFRSELDKIGATYQGGSQFSIQALAKDFERAAELLADGTLHPALPEAALQALKPQYVQFFTNWRQSPDYLAARAEDEALLPANDPDLREPTPQSLLALTQPDLVAYHKSVMRPDMTAIVVIGAVTPSEARRVIEKTFGAWQAQGDKPVVDPPVVANNAAKSVAVPDASRVQDKVSLSQTMVLNRKHADYAALTLGNAVLSEGGFSARLYDDLRVKSGLVYFVNSTLDAGRTRGNFSVSYASDPGNVSKAATMVVNDIVEMQNKPIAAETLQNAKAMLLRQIPLGEESTGSIAAGYLHRFDLDLPYDEPVRLAEQLAKLTPEDVRIAFKRWLRPADFVRVTQGPEPK